jgi:hypothetical protein
MIVLALFAWSPSNALPPEQSTEPRKIRITAQPRPGAELQDIEMEIHTVPTKLTTVPARAVADMDLPLMEYDLVLGVLAGGEAMAYPIRYLAIYEIVDDRVGEHALAPTW